MTFRKAALHVLRGASLALLGALLVGCNTLITQGVRHLNFQPAPRGTTTNAATLLVNQRVAPTQLTTIPDALAKAPDGSVILVCWRETHLSNFWGPCSHIARKYDATRLAETISPTEGGANLYPISRVYNRYAVIVLDAGVRDEHLQAVRQEADKLNGLQYDVSGKEGTYYCSTYQNRLQRVAGLPDVVPYNALWNLYIPAEVLLQPHVKVLWVGVNDTSVTPPDAKRLPTVPRPL